MKYRTAQLRRAWNAAAKPEHRIICTPAELRSECQDVHMQTGRRYMEMAAYEAKNGTTQTIEF